MTLPAVMLARAGPLPSGPGWRHEVKWDGVRALAEVDAGAVRLVGRSGRDATAAYPELAALGPALVTAAPAVLDGEVVLLRDGRPDFAGLQERMHVADPGRAQRLAAREPVTYVAFDLLRRAGEDLLDVPCGVRREALEAVVDARAMAAAGGRLLLTPAWPSEEVSGTDVLAAVRAQGLEGLVAKRTSSPYAPGRRSEDWVKVRVQHTEDVVVVGWEPGAGSRDGRLGALLVAEPDGHGRLRYRGQVGTGFTDATLADLGARLADLAADASALDAEALSDVPAAARRSARWVRPELVARVSYASRTPAGRLRHPSFQALVGAS